jgi:hypothetical protein
MTNFYVSELEEMRAYLTKDFERATRGRNAEGAALISSNYAIVVKALHEMKSTDAHKLAAAAKP